MRQVVTKNCPVCRTSRPQRVVERFALGRFLECPGCGIHFAETVDVDLRAYYADIWSPDGDG